MRGVWLHPYVTVTVRVCESGTACKCVRDAYDMLV